MTQQQAGDGAMHSAVPVHAVRRPVTGVTTEGIMQVDNVEAMI